MQNVEKSKHLSILLGSINPYSYLGHSQRMFSLAHCFAKRGMEVTWMNSPSFAFLQNSKFIMKETISRNLYPFFLVREDKLTEDISISIYDSWAPPKYDKLDVSLYFTRFLQKVYSSLLSQLQRIDVFLFDSPIFADLAARMKKLQDTLIIYHSPDDYFAYSEIGRSFKQLEKSVVNVSDIIVAPTQSIRRSILGRNKSKLDVHIIPNGVPKAEITKVPIKRKPETVPRIGFIGTLASWVDVNLVFNIATRMHHCDFVIVGDGPYYNYWKQRSPLNCTFIGRVSIAKRKDIISSFDVGLIPFKLNSLTNSAFPLKLLEYFSRGVPVVSSPLVEIRKIATGFVYFAKDTDQWVYQINNALNENYDSKVSYLDFASKYTWEYTADLLLDVFSRN